MASTVWRGYITFGLISIPVRLFRAARAERVSLRKLYRSNGSVSPSRGKAEDRPDDEVEESSDDSDGRNAAAAVATNLQNLHRLEAKGQTPERVPTPVLEPVRQANLRNNTDEVLPERAVVKGYEYEKNRFVALDPEELKSLAPKTASEMQIEEFVNLNEVDPVFFETSYYLVPEEAGKKAYALLYRALQNTNLVAVAQFAMHSREHVVLLRPGKTGLIAHTMFYSSEVRADEEFRADTDAVTPKELQLAETLIHSLSATFDPAKYHDTYREKLESLIASKVAGEPVAREEEPKAKSSTVVDITEALQRSLAALKKPPVKDQSASRPATHSAAPAARPKTKRAAR
jgi:DNA end-binding protein Ku